MGGEASHLASVFDFLIYILDKQKLPRFFLLVSIASIVPALAVVIADTIRWLMMHPTIESVGPQGTLRLKMGAFTPEVYTLLVHPRGWQPTGITVSPGDQLVEKHYGETNMGLDVVAIEENAKRVRAFMDAVRKKMKVEGISEREAIKKLKCPDYLKPGRYGWPWVGAEGYSWDLPASLDKVPSSFSADTTLISNRYPSGRLLAYIGDPSKFDDKRLIDFAVENITIPSDVEKNAMLWLAVNDSTLSVWKYDNFGFLMVTIERR